MGWIDATPVPLATEDIVKITFVNRVVSFWEKKNGIAWVYNFNCIQYSLLQLCRM